MTARKGYRCAVRDARTAPNRTIPKTANRAPTNHVGVAPIRTGSTFPDFLRVVRPSRPFPAGGTLQERLQWCKDHPRHPVTWENVVRTIALCDRNYARPTFFYRLIHDHRPGKGRVVMAAQLAAVVGGLPGEKPPQDVLAYSGGKVWNGKIWCCPTRLERQALGRLA